MTIGGENRAVLIVLPELCAPFHAQSRAGVLAHMGLNT